jgi:hypothetical protein
MRILFINNGGGGFADHVEVETGTTISAFLGKHVPNYSPDDYLIRVNRQIASRDQVLNDNDRVSCTARKIEGARRLQRVQHRI